MDATATEDKVRQLLRRVGMLEAELRQAKLLRRLHGLDDVRADAVVIDDVSDIGIGIEAKLAWSCGRAGDVAYDVTPLVCFGVALPTEIYVDPSGVRYRARLRAVWKAFHDKGPRTYAEYEFSRA